MEKRDEHFEEKIHEILLIYKEVNAINESKKGDEILPVITFSVDEKPGVQAIKNTAPDLLPKEGTDPYIRRDYEYQRLGTLSVLASLDFIPGTLLQ